MDGWYLIPTAADDRFRFPAHLRGEQAGVRSSIGRRYQDEDEDADANENGNQKSDDSDDLSKEFFRRG